MLQINGLDSLIEMSRSSEKGEWALRRLGYKQGCRVEVETGAVKVGVEVVLAGVIVGVGAGRILPTPTTARSR